MARKQVFIVECDRCGAAREDQNMSPDETVQPKLRVSYRDTTGEFFDLCERCAGRVESLVRGILLIRELENTGVDERSDDSESAHHGGGPPTGLA